MRLLFSQVQTRIDLQDQKTIDLHKVGIEIAIGTEIDVEEDEGEDVVGEKTETGEKDADVVINHAIWKNNHLWSLRD